MSWRGWGEEESLWLEDFICGLLGGMMAFFNLIGWILLNWNMVAPKWLAILSVATGLLCGSWLLYERWKEKKDEQHRKNSQ